MTQEDKDLLLKDLSARLPYHTNCFSEYADDNWAILTPAVYSHTANCLPNEIGIKPYLFPLSSMTEEQKIELEQIKNNEDAPYYHDINDFFLKYHLDNRHLIEKGLAIDATGLNIY